MKSILEISQVVVSVILIALVLLQQRGSGLGSVFGGGGGEVYHQRRGMEKWIFRGTVVLAFAFLALSIATFLIK